ncbi:hypothetical protein [Gordonia sputi]
MTRAQLIERILFAVDGYRFGEWDLAEATARITRLIVSNPEAVLGGEA